MMPVAVESTHYLDHNATSPVRPEARRAVADAMEHVGNASSVHRFGRVARRLIENARETVAGLVGAVPGDVIFTSGGTEANNLAVHGAGRTRALVSAVEHVSILDAVPGAERIPVDGDGVLDIEALDRLLAGDSRPALVCVMLANNETGVVQPIAEVAAIAHKYGARVHCDAVQAAGRIAVDIGALGVDSLSLSAHKIGGPMGVGALVLGCGVPLQGGQRGGGQESGRRAGTENLPGIAGFAAAVAATDPSVQSGLAALRDRVETETRRICPASKVYGRNTARLANTTCLSMPGVTAETQVMALDLAGVAVSAGAACSSGKVKASHVLAAMGIDKAEAETAIRISFGWNSNADDVDRFLEAWTQLWIRAGSGTSDGNELKYG